MVLSYAESRFRWGTLSFCEPSRFVEEIEEKFLDFPRSRSLSQSSSLSNPYKSILSKKNRAFISKPSSISGDAGKSTYKRIQTEASGIVNRPTSNFKAAEIDDLQVNMEVEHQRFGRGKILRIEGVGSNKKATVHFSKIGEKQLLLRFAKLRIVK